jgi:hypothetical protein
MIRMDRLVASEKSNMGPYRVHWSCEQAPGQKSNHVVPIGWDVVLVETWPCAPKLVQVHKQNLPHVEPRTTGGIVDMYNESIHFHPDAASCSRM